MLRRVVVELQQHVGVVDDLRDGLRELRAVGSSNAVIAARAFSCSNRIFR
jgi:hypothetical protein